VSQENVEIVRGAHAEFERGNFWIPEIFDPSVRVVWLPVAGGETETVGLDSMARMMMTWMQPWEQVTTVAERVVDAGDPIPAVPTPFRRPCWGCGRPVYASGGVWPQVRVRLAAIGGPDVRHPVVECGSERALGQLVRSLRLTALNPADCATRDATLRG
jgi:hypothetical protein